MEKKISVQKRIKNIISHITKGLKERDEALALALLSTISGETLLILGPHGIGKSLVKQRVNCAFQNAQKITRKKLISTSNEIPESEEFDSFLLRMNLKPIQDEKTFLKLISDKKANDELTKAEEAVSDEELGEGQKSINDVKITSEVQDVILYLRRKMTGKTKKSPYISDDRWARIAWLLKSAAFLNGRKTVDLMDCQLIPFCIWNNSLSLEDSRKIVHEAIFLNAHKFDKSISHIEDLIQDYSNFIEKSFFIDSENGEKIKSPELFGYTRAAKPFPFEMTDGTTAYRILKPQEIRSYDYITPYYVSESFKGYDDGEGAYFDEFKERVEKNDTYRDKYFVTNFRIIEDEGNGRAVWTDGDCKKEYSFDIKMTPEEYVSGDTEKLVSLRSEAENKYKNLLETIRNEGEKIQKFINSKERQYKSNLFADTSICEKILAPSNRSKERLAQAAKKLSEIAGETF